MEDYSLDPEKVYFSEDLLTLPREDGTPETLRVGEWVSREPVRIHKMIVREKVLKVDQLEVFTPLVSKLRRADYEYYRRITGLNMTIDFPGYSASILARIPFDTDPVGFYKWWRKGKHEHIVYLGPAYQYKLFQKVAAMEPKVILKKDLDFVKNF